MGVGGVEDGSRDGNGRRQRQTISGVAGASVGDGGAGNGRRRKQGQPSSKWAAE